jgi:hypothetical protein
MLIKINGFTVFDEFCIVKIFHAYSSFFQLFKLLAAYNIYATRFRAYFCNIKDRMQFMLRPMHFPVMLGSLFCAVVGIGGSYAGYPLFVTTFFGRSAVDYAVNVLCHISPLFLLFSLTPHKPWQVFLLRLSAMPLHTLWQVFRIEAYTTVRPVRKDGVLAIVAEIFATDELPGF